MFARESRHAEGANSITVSSTGLADAFRSAAWSEPRTRESPTGSQASRAAAEEQSRQTLATGEPRGAGSARAGALVGRRADRGAEECVSQSGAGLRHRRSSSLISLRSTPIAPTKLTQPAMASTKHALNASEGGSAGAIDQVSSSADNQQYDNDDGGDGRGDHLYVLESLAQERQHPTCPKDCEPRGERQDGHRLVAKAHVEPVVAAVGPGSPPHGQIQEIRAGDHEEDDLPLERLTRRVLPWLTDEEEHPGDQVRAKPQHPPWQQAMHVGERNLSHRPEDSQVHGQQHTE